MPLRTSLFVQKDHECVSKSTVTLTQQGGTLAGNTLSRHSAQISQNLQN